MDELLVKGDMIGDKICVAEEHRIKARNIYDEVSKSTTEKYVIAVSGPSGSGKSEIASLLATQYLTAGKKSYVISCDNYVKLAPRDNEDVREKIYSTSQDIGLREFLGTDKEIDFQRLNEIIKDFKAGKEMLSLRFIDNPNNIIKHDKKLLGFSDIEVIIIEGTWSMNIDNCDKKVFLENDYEATMAHRKRRGRDPLTAFGEKVLAIEQEKIERLHAQADYIVKPSGHVIEVDHNTD